LSAQTVIVTDLPVTVNKVLDFNHSEDGVTFPIFGWGGQSSNIFPNVSLNSWRSTDVPQWYIDYTNKRMKEENVKNDYTPVPRKVVFKKDNKIVTKEYQTYIEYFYLEGCGADLQKTVIVKDLVLANYNDLLGVFSTDIVNKECLGRYIEINNPDKHFLTPNKRYEVGNYIIEHKATLLEKDSVFRINADGSRRVINVGGSQWANIELSITNKQNNKSQLLLKTPNQFTNGYIKSILISDINCDSIDDIILIVTSDSGLCLYRLFYLSTPNSDSLFEFVGYSEECICP